MASQGTLIVGAGDAVVPLQDLDGETNLKRKEVPRQFRGLSIHDAVKHAKAGGSRSLSPSVIMLSVVSGNC